MTGSEAFTVGGRPLGFDLLSFWQWYASDLLSNATRGMLAEYIVATALGASGGVRTEWDAFDILLEMGVRVEVKSGAYLQTWFHKRLSRIVFNIAPSRAWDSTTGLYAEQTKRQADVYVFALLRHLDKESVDPMDLDQWVFSVLSTGVLNERLPSQKTLSLSALLRLDPLVSTFATLKHDVWSCATSPVRSGASSENQQELSGF